MKKFAKKHKSMIIFTLALVGVCTMLTALGVIHPSATGLALLPIIGFGIVTTDLTGENITAGVPATGLQRAYVLKNQVTIPLTAVTGDIHQVLPIKARTLVLSAWLEVVTPGVATAVTYDLGVTGGTDNAWCDAQDLTSAAGVILPTAILMSAPATFKTADTIDLLAEDINTMTVAPVVNVFALCIDMP
jgi:hypothetical protein